MIRRRSLMIGTMASVACMPFRAALAAAPTLDEIRKQGYMRIATTGADAPYNFVGPDGALAGFDIDWSRLICSGLGVESRFSYLSWNGILPGLMAGQYDGVMSAVRITPERAANFTFSIPYTSDSVAVMVRQDNTAIKEIEDLRGLVVGTASGSILEATAETMARAGTLRSYPGLPNIIMDLMAGRLDAGVVGRAGALYAIKTQQLPLKVVGRSINPQPIAMILPRGATELAEAVSRQIKARQDDGQAKILSERWFGN
ncbi:substrate-binding periplasmic protein [Gluconacetobacter asukensis]|uniref:Transporter substrate-binding domain-containing protein n=1 Tax=Gluconacetobacter asukensis TaxID=1017181 RepID=A0A7W4J2M9_9PROT|nr:transporter substrate-binding domain-containing protein [Gluconacetobacter asukensis]MBB2173581.1 transporter substrate-binding domain-containing protein [Gluconacetobacter asukensis]